MRCIGVRAGSAANDLVLVVVLFLVLPGEVVGEREIKGRGSESTCFRIRGGVGESTWRASSSESRISSMSMKRPDPLGGVEGVLTLVFAFILGFGGKGSKIGVEDAGYDFGSLPRFFGELFLLGGAEAGSLNFRTGDFCIWAEGVKSKSSMSTKLFGDSAFWFEGGGTCVKLSMSSKIVSSIGPSFLRSSKVGDAREVASSGVGKSDDVGIAGGGSGGMSSISMNVD